MTWHEHAIATEPAGQVSTAREGVLVVCDGCRCADEWFSRAVFERGGTVGIQKLLYRKGWTLDSLTQADRCLICSHNPSSLQLELAAVGGRS